MIEEKIKYLQEIATKEEKGYHSLTDPLSIEMEFGKMLMDAIVQAKPKNIVEIGTGYGYSTSWLILGTILNGFGDIETWEHEVREPKIFDTLGLKPKVEHRTTFIGKDLPKSIDFLFHDSQHAYELITADMELLLPRMAKKAQIWIHDSRDALAKRLEDYFKEKGWSFREINESWGMGIATRD